MRYLFIFLFSFCLVFTSRAQDFNGPESVAWFPQQDVYFVSNSGNGTIARADLSSGSLQVSVFASTGLNFPRGLKIVGDTLYATDLSVIRLINLGTGVVFASVDVPGSASLNDIELAGDYLYLSDNQNSKIYRYHYATRQVAEAFSDAAIQAPNGLLFDEAGSRLLVVSFRSNAPVQAIALPAGSISTVATTTYSNMDGICRDNQGNFYISYWGSNFISGKIVKYAPDFSNPVPFAQNLNGPADILSDPVHQRIVVPVMTANTVEFLSLCNVLTGNISGYDEANVNDEVFYSVDASAGSTYDWSVNGGQILSGNGSSTIHVKWTVPGTAVVSVVETDASSCVGEPVSLNVQVALNSFDNQLAPFDFTLYPNPSGGLFTVSLVVDEPSELQISLLDLAGNFRKNLKEAYLNPGLSKFSFHGSELGIPKGVYFLRTQVGNLVMMKRLVLAGH